VQDAHGILAVLAGGVEVAADVEPVLGGVVAGLSTSFIPAGPGPQRRLVMPRANTCTRGSGNRITLSARMGNFTGVGHV
jgi:hypothetical protein